jgi:hypothetical protein
MKQNHKAELQAMKQQIVDLTQVVQTGMRQQQVAVPQVAMR